MGIELSPKDQHLADNFFGGPSKLRGSAKACYKQLHPRCKDSTAETEGPAILRKPQVKSYLDSKARKLRDETEINAQWVLEQSILLYHRCMGDEAYPVEIESTDPGTSVITVETVYRRSFNPAGAKAALELIGRNRGIQAFKENIEVSHTHYLEQQLARRAKAVEGRALGALGTLPALPGRSPAPGNQVEAGGQVYVDAQPGGSEKEGASSGGQPNVSPA